MSVAARWRVLGPASSALGIAWVRNRTRCRRGETGKRRDPIHLRAKALVGSSPTAGTAAPGSSLRRTECAGILACVSDLVTRFATQPSAEACPRRSFLHTRVVKDPPKSPDVDRLDALK